MSTLDHRYHFFGHHWLVVVTDNSVYTLSPPTETKWRRIWCADAAGEPKPMPFSRCQLWELALGASMLLCWLPEVGTMKLRITSRVHSITALSRRPAALRRTQPL